MKKLENYKVIADCIATLLFPHAEVILHDLASQTVVHIANNLSKRALGDDSALEELPGDFDQAASLGPYEKLNWDGQKIRSITGVLRDDAGNAEVLMCINLNFSVLDQARDALNAFFQVSRLPARIFEPVNQGVACALNAIIQLVGGGVHQLLGPVDQLL